MPQSKSLLALIASSLLLAATNVPRATAKDPDAEQTTVLLRKQVGSGEITCAAGPNLDAAMFRDIAGPDSVDQYVAWYEFHVDWQVPGRPTTRLWSTVFAVGKRRLANARFQDVKPSSPEARERIGVMDILVLPSMKWIPARMIMAVRSPGGGSFSLDRVDVGGGAASSWPSPAPHEWTEYDTPTAGDPASVTLSVSAAGLCRAEVRSDRRHTVYRQLEGRWEFALEKQWRE